MYAPLEENTVVLNDSMMMVPSLSFCLLSVGLQILQDFPTRRRRKRELGCGHAAPEGRGNQEQGLLLKEVGRQHWEERNSSGGRGHGDVGGKERKGEPLPGEEGKPGGRSAFV